VLRGAPYIAHGNEKERRDEDAGSLDGVLFVVGAAVAFRARIAAPAGHSTKTAPNQLRHEKSQAAPRSAARAIQKLLIAQAILRRKYDGSPDAECAHCRMLCIQRGAGFGLTKRLDVAYAVLVSMEKGFVNPQRTKQTIIEFD